MAVAKHDTFDVDGPVIEALRAGDRYAFEEFVRRHGRWVRGVIYGVLGESDRVDDVAQHVWATVWQRIGELRNPERWRPWLYRLSRNAATDAGRDITRRRERIWAAAADLTRRTSRDLPDADLAHRERKQAVLDAIKALPTLYREPFVMRHLNGWTYEEIAEVMGMPIDSVETRLVRARRLLRDFLKDKVL